jgi:hypothetical protein
MSPDRRSPGSYDRDRWDQGRGMTERAAPFYCPYCADENLRPFGEVHGEWRCGACQRVFRIGYIGIAADWTRPVLSANESRESPVER